LKSNIAVKENFLVNIRISGRQKDRIFLAIILSPALLILCLTIFIPIIRTLEISFLDMHLINMGQSYWNNFKNYKDIFSTNEFLTSFKNTIVFAFSVVGLQFILGMILALILNKDIKYRRLLRSVILIPWIVPILVTGLLWMWIFQPEYGVMNFILIKLGIFDIPQKWTADINLALPSVMIAALWRQLPFMATMLLAGMQGIPEDMYEAATIDGASKLRMFYHITLPFLTNVIQTVTLVAIIENFKMFPLFWIMTKGGPLMATTTLAVHSYQTAFIGLNLGKGAAIGVVWVTILVFFSWGYNRAFSKEW
jgi:multiple sugar transport system permease protein